MDGVLNMLRYYEWSWYGETGLLMSMFWMACSFLGLTESIGHTMQQFRALKFVLQNMTGCKCHVTSMATTGFVQYHPKLKYHKEGKQMHEWKCRKEWQTAPSRRGCRDLVHPGIEICLPNSAYYHIDLIQVATSGWEVVFSNLLHEFF